MILAGITLFKPDVERLMENINSIINQVDELICVDNGSDNINDIEHKIHSKYPEIKFIDNDSNLGIAKALNQMFEYAKKKGYEWVLTLDQDSVCPENIISEYKKYMSQDIACMCPIITDVNYNQIEHYNGHTEEVERCITSASLNSVKVWEEIGGFFEKLFIDFVDHDYCAKVIEHKYKILRINTVFLKHEIGHGANKNFLGKRVTALNHSAFRKYYMVRNGLYFVWAHKSVINYPKEKAKIYFLFVKTILYENNKRKKIKAMIKGYRDGKKLISEIKKMGGM